MIFSWNWKAAASGVRVSYGSETVLIPYAQLFALGEYTNEDGPFGEDHFLVLVTSERVVYEAAVVDLEVGFLDQLQKNLGAKITLGLLGSTTFASRVLWPPQRVEDPLLSFRKSGLFTVSLELDL